MNWPAPQPPQQPQGDKTWHGVPVWGYPVGIIGIAVTLLVGWWMR